MKKNLFTLFFVFVFTNLFAQQNNKIAPAFRYMLLHPLNSETQANYPELYKIETVSVFDSAVGNYVAKLPCIIYTKNPQTFRSMGIVVQAEFPNFVTAFVTLSQINELAALEEVRYIDAPKIIMPNNDISVGTSGASLLHNAKLNNTNYKGDGVIVGIFDTGIDWDHPDFRNATDQTKSRILKIWDQTITPISGEISLT